MKKKKLKTGKSKDDLIKKSKASREEKIEKSTKKKGKKIKEAKAEKPVKKLKKSKDKSDEKSSKKVKSGKTKKASSTGRKKKELPTYAPIKQMQNRGQQMQDLLDRVNLDELLPKIELSERDQKKVVKAFVEALESQIAGHVVPGGSGTFTFPGLFKIVTKHVPAKPKRKGINPFTKEEQVFAAKPATTKVRVRAMKKLKDMAVA